MAMGGDEEGRGRGGAVARRCRFPRLGPVAKGLGTIMAEARGEKAAQAIVHWFVERGKSVARVGLAGQEGW